MRHWYLSLCMGGVLPAGWIESNQQLPATLVFVTLYGWCLACWLDWIQPTITCDTGICHFVWVVSCLLVGLNPTNNYLRHWYLSLCMGGVLSAGWVESNQQLPVSLRYSNFLLMMGTWMPETCTEEK